MGVFLRINMLVILTWSGKKLRLLKISKKKEKKATANSGRKHYQISQ